MARSSLHALSTILFLLRLLLSPSTHALKLPFRVNDVLPVLPHGISWPLLNNLHSAVDLLPSFVAAVPPDNDSVQWRAACFYDNQASLEFTAPGHDDADGLGGAVLRLKVSL